MAEKVRIVHYLNQFFAGIGGEDKGDAPVAYSDGPKGPGMGLVPLLKDQGEIVRTIWCGDNRINQNQEESLDAIEVLITEAKPDVVIAGPAFNAGRYGLACGMVAKLCGKKLQVPTLVGMHPENPAVEIYRQEGYIVPTAATVAGMKHVLPVLAELSLKVGREGKLGPAHIEGYIPRGFRWNEYVEKNGARRAIDMLFRRLDGEEPQTEVPLRGFEQVPPANPLEDVKHAKIALVTGGGMVPKGNPDNLKQAFADAFAVYPLEGLEELPAGDFKGIHGGFDSTYVDEDPDRVVPLDVMRELEKEGAIGELLNEYYVLCGIGTNVAASKKLGSEIAEELKRKEVAAAIYTST